MKSTVAPADPQASALDDTAVDIPEDIELHDDEAIDASVNNVVA